MVSRARGPISAGHLLAQLRRDPEYLARQAEQEGARQVRREFLRLNQKPILDDLERLGVHVDSVLDIPNDSLSAAVVDVLFSHLDRVYEDAVHEDIARQLSASAARKYSDQLISRYLALDGRVNPRKKEGLASAVACHLKSGDLSLLLTLLRDRRHGSSRVLLLKVLRRTRSRIDPTILDELRADPDLAGEIASWRKVKTDR